MKYINMKRCWLLTLLTLMSVGIWAQQKNVLSVPDAKVSIGQAQLPVAIENTDEIVAIQFDLTLPSTISAGTNGVLTNRCDDHTIIIRNIEATRYRVMLYSDNNLPLRAQQGTVLYVPLIIPQTVTEGSELPLVISNATLTAASGENVLTEAKAGKLIVSMLPDLTVKGLSGNSSDSTNPLLITPGERLSLSWQVQNVGGTETGGGWSEQILLVNKRGTVTKLIGTVYQSEKLAAGAVMSRQADITVPQLLGIEDEAYVQVHVVANSETGESSLATGNNTAQSEDVFTVGKRLFVEPNPARMVEKSTSRVAVKVSRSGNWNSEQTFTLCTNNDTRVTLPSQVTMPIGQSGTIVYMTVEDNSVLDNDSVVTITAKGNGYADAQGKLIIEDNEYPNLTLTTSKSAVTEGESFQLTVTTSRVSKQPITVTLTSENAKRFTFPQTVTIPADETLATVDVTAVDDNSPGVEIDNAFTASAWHYNKAEVFVLLQDDDMPSISLSLSPTTITESAGPVAMMAVLRRTSHVDQDITVKLSDDSQFHDINYGQFSSISMAKGVEEVTFSLGINDNLEVDGDRDVTITAAVYIQSCSCSASNEGAGVVSQMIHIIDNDGPALSIASSRSMLLEGAEEATVLTVSRNTSTDIALPVSISSSYDEGLEYYHSVVIPTGEKLVKIPVKALANYIQDDDVTVTFTVTAEGHSNGTCWAMISDQTLPDAIISSIELQTTDGERVGDDPVYVSTDLQALLTIENIGVAQLPAGVVVNVYNGSNRIASMLTPSVLASGETLQMTSALTVPERISSYSIYAKVNEGETVSELLYANNNSSTMTFKTRSTYNTMVSVDKSLMNQGDSVTISGHLLCPDGSEWGDRGPSNVNLYLIVEGNRYVQTMTTDAQGQFSYVWKPSSAYMGHVSIGACYPGETTRDEMASVDIHGMRNVGNVYTTLYTVIDKPYEGTVSVKNPGRIPLTGLRVAATEQSDDVTIRFEAPETIGGGETVTIRYTLIGNKLTEGDDWETVKFDMTTAEGPKLSHTLYYYTRNPQAQLSCSLKQINTTITKGGSRDYSFSIANVGMGETGKISIELPKWIQSVTPRELSSLALGDTVQVVLRFTPTDDMQLNIPVTGRIGINCENGNGLSVPFSIEPVSESTGVLVVDVCDEYTYNTAEAPHVIGATVSLLHPVTGAVIVSDTTETDGCFHAILPEGYYTLVVTHQKHDSYRATIQIDPAKTMYKVVNLSYNAIEISWEVVETELEDTYEIVTSVKYETNVPVPMVTVNLPESIPAKELDEGESLVYYAVLTNKGLITAEDVQYTMPEGFSVLTFERLDNLDEPLNIAPGQSVVIPIKVTNNTSTSDSRRRTKPVSDPCVAQSVLGWFWECGTDRKWHKYSTGLRVGECKQGDALQAFNRGDGDAGIYTFEWTNSGPSGTSRPNYPSINFFKTETSTSNQNKTNSTGESYQCTPCQNSAMLALAKFLPFVGDVIKAAETVRDVYNCYDSFKTEEGVYNKLSNCKYTSFATKYYDTVNTVCDDIVETCGHGQKIAEQIRNDEFFTDDCQEEWKELFSSLFQTGIDAADLAIQAQNIYYKGKKYEKSTESLMDDVKSFSSDVTETNKVITDYENSYKLDRTEDYISNRKLDLEANGLNDIVAEQRENSLKESLYQYATNNSASSKEYVGIAEFAVKKLQDKEIKGSDVNKLGKNVFKVLSDCVYNMHVFAENAKTTSVTKQSLIKSEWLDTTKKMEKYVGTAAELLHYTFGECEYEGDETSDDSFEAGGGAGGGGSESQSRRRILSVNFRNAIPASYQRLVDDMLEAINMVQTQAEIEKEYFGSEEWLNLSDMQLVMVSWAIEQLEKYGPDVIDDPLIGIYCPEGISEDMLKTFLRRLYNSRERQATSRRLASKATDEDDGLIDFQRINQLQESIAKSAGKILKGGESSIEEAIQNKFDTAYYELSEGTSSVCASVTLQFNQTMTMTRQAFRGTLKVHNGNTEESMKDIVLEMEVRNASDGGVATSREMQMNVESLVGFEGALNFTDGWTLAANGDGTATIIFIPSKYAAPTEPQDYTFGGRLKYLDPFTGLVVTRELSPVTLTVKPSPELDLTYFMQRDVYGDDPLTLDVVESMKPAEFALLINNKGYGDATNVRMVTQQPEIIENEKGLHIDFELISSQLNGVDATLSFGQSIANDFGTIPAHSQMYAQWWLTSTLLGHFTEYDVHATHVTSYGNPDLSLLDQVTIHELIHSFDMPDGSLNGGPNVGRAFLVNDIEDANDLPDNLYFSNGDTASVAVTTTAQIVRRSSTECELIITPSSQGWNYGSLMDPTHGYAKLKSIVRQSDGQELGNTRFWQTDRTLCDGKDWLYEYRLHFVDDFEGLAPETYVLTFDPVPDVVLAVASITTLPEDGTIAEAPIEKLIVDFNKEIDAMTFTGDDITFAVQGVKKDANQIGISTENNKSFTLDLATLTEQCPNGYYTLTVQTADITDAEGFQGKTGMQVGWILFRDGLVQLLTSAWPENSGSVTRKSNEEAGARGSTPVEEKANTAKYGSTVTLAAEPETGYEFANWTLNGEVVSTDLEFTTTALSDMNVVANFTKKKYMVKIASSDDTKGSVTGTATGIYDHGTQIEVTAVPGEDYALMNWTVGGETVENSGDKLTLTAEGPLTITAEFLQEYFRQSMTLARGWNWMSSYLNEPLAIDGLSNYVYRIVSQTDEIINDPEYGLVGTINELEVGKAYKVEANSRFTKTFRGHLYNVGTAPIALHKGWNWMAYPYQEQTALATAITNAREGDYISSQTGFAEYAEGHWEGTLDILTPGAGYLYKSANDKTLAFDFSSAVDGSRAWKAQTATVTEQDVDIHRYPNTMNMIVQIFKDGMAVTASDYNIYAMVNDELRGISRSIGRNQYLTVYGDKPVEVTFIVESAETGETYIGNETLKFVDDVVGSRKQPFMLNIGRATGIDVMANDGRPMTVYTLQGILVSRETTLKMLHRLPKGIYVVNGQKCLIK